MLEFLTLRFYADNFGDRVLPVARGVQPPAPPPPVPVPVRPPRRFGLCSACGMMLLLCAKLALLHTIAFAIRTHPFLRQVNGTVIANAAEATVPRGWNLFIAGGRARLRVTASAGTHASLPGHATALDGVAQGDALASLLRHYDDSVDAVRLPLPHTWQSLFEEALPAPLTLLASEPFAPSLPLPPLEYAVGERVQVRLGTPVDRWLWQGARWANATVIAVYPARKLGDFRYAVRVVGDGGAGALFAGGCAGGWLGRWCDRLDAGLEGDGVPPPPPVASARGGKGWWPARAAAPPRGGAGGGKGVGGPQPAFQYKRVRVTVMNRSAAGLLHVRPGFWHHSAVPSGWSQSARDALGLDTWLAAKEKPGEKKQSGQSQREKDGGGAGDTRDTNIGIGANASTSTGASARASTSSVEVGADASTSAAAAQGEPRGAPAKALSPEATVHNASKSEELVIVRCNKHSQCAFDEFCAHRDFKSGDPLADSNHKGICFVCQYCDKHERGVNQNCPCGPLATGEFARQRKLNIPTVTVADLPREAGRAGPAELAGLKVNDTILAIGGVSVGMLGEGGMRVPNDGRGWTNRSASLLMALFNSSNIPLEIEVLRYEEAGARSRAAGGERGDGDGDGDGDGNGDGDGDGDEVEEQVARGESSEEAAADSDTGVKEPTASVTAKPQAKPRFGGMQDGQDGVVFVMPNRLRRPPTVLFNSSMLELDISDCIRSATPAAQHRMGAAVRAFFAAPAVGVVPLPLELAAQWAPHQLDRNATIDARRGHCVARELEPHAKGLRAARMLLLRAETCIAARHDRARCERARCGANDTRAHKATGGGANSTASAGADDGACCTWKVDSDIDASHELPVVGRERVVEAQRLCRGLVGREPMEAAGGEQAGPEQRGPSRGSGARNGNDERDADGVAQGLEQRYRAIAVFNPFDVQQLQGFSPYYTGFWGWRRTAGEPEARLRMPYTVGGLRRLRQLWAAAALVCDVDIHTDVTSLFSADQDARVLQRDLLRPGEAPPSEPEPVPYLATLFRKVDVLTGGFAAALSIAWDALDDSPLDKHTASVKKPSVTLPQLQCSRDTAASIARTVLQLGGGAGDVRDVPTSAPSTEHKVGERRADEDESKPAGGKPDGRQLPHPLRLLAVFIPGLCYDVLSRLGVLGAVRFPPRLMWCLSFFVFANLAFWHQQLLADSGLFGLHTVFKPLLMWFYALTEVSFWKMLLGRLFPAEGGNALVRVVRNPVALVGAVSMHVFSLLFLPMRFIDEWSESNTGFFIYSPWGGRIRRRRNEHRIPFFERGRWWVGWRQVSHVLRFVRLAANAFVGQRLFTAMPLAVMYTFTAGVAFMELLNVYFLVLVCWYVPIAYAICALLRHIDTPIAPFAVVAAISMYVNVAMILLTEFMSLLNVVLGDDGYGVLHPSIALPDGVLNWFVDEDGTGGLFFGLPCICTALTTTGIVLVLRARATKAFSGDAAARRAARRRLRSAIASEAKEKALSSLRGRHVGVEQLVTFYKKHEPTKVKDAKGILATYKRDEMLSAIWDKYGALPAGVDEGGTCRDAEAEAKAETASGPAQQEEQEQVCRICYEPACAELGELMSPCLCRGSVRFVHAQCLRTWRFHSANPASRYECDSCSFRYVFRRSWKAAVFRSALVLHVHAFIGLVALTLIAGYMAKGVDEFVFGNIFDSGARDMLRSDLMQLVAGDGAIAHAAVNNPWWAVDVPHMLSGAAFIGFISFLSFGMFGPIFWNGGGGHRGGGMSLIVVAVAIGLARAFFLVLGRLTKLSGRYWNTGSEIIVNVEEALGLAGGEDSDDEEKEAPFVLPEQRSPPQGRDRVVLFEGRQVPGPMLPPLFHRDDDNGGGGGDGGGEGEGGGAGGNGAGGNGDVDGDGDGDGEGDGDAGGRNIAGVVPPDAPPGANRGGGADEDIAAARARADEEFARRLQREELEAARVQVPWGLRWMVPGFGAEGQAGQQAGAAQRANGGGEARGDRDGDGALGEWRAVANDPWVQPANAFVIAVVLLALLTFFDAVSERVGGS